ncbi:MAG: permease, partial [Candidatus Kapaibacteriota bacterium]
MDLLKEIWIVFNEMAPYLLLGIFFVAILDLFVSKKLILKQISRNNISSIIKTALFGVPLPLCSCGVVPTSVYLEKNGASKPSVVSFLICTPQTGIDSIIATYGLLGPIFALFRPIAAFVMGIIGGIVTLFVQKNEERQTPTFPNFESIEIDNYENGKKIFQKLTKSFRYAFLEFIDDISTQFVIGLVIAG